MRKYILIAVNSLSEYFAYRLNFILWRVRVVISILISFFLWQAIFFSKSQVFGYDRAQMMTYIILLSFINGVVLSSQTFKVAYEINMGILSKYLLQPVHYFAFNLSRDFTDKLINTVFSIFEIGILLVLLKPPFFLQLNILWLLLFIFATILAALLYFEINMILSFIGFWSRETWAPRFIFFILVSFLAGTYFPLDIMPVQIYRLLQILPFAYLVFFPLKIYLGQMEGFLLLKGFLIVFLWLLVLWFIMNFLWRKGLKIYTAEGS